MTRPPHDPDSPTPAGFAAMTHDEFETFVRESGMQAEAEAALAAYRRRPELRAPGTDTWMGLSVSPDERPSTPLTFAWIVLAGLVCIAGGLALMWAFTR